MKITILGSGTFVPYKKRKCSSYLIETSTDKILLDIGRGAISRLGQLKVPLVDINNIFISHMHSDHASELAPFISYIIDNPEKKKLKAKYTIYGPEGLKKRVKKLLEVFGISKHKNLKIIRIIEIKDKEDIKLGKLLVRGFRVTGHGKSVECMAYRLNVKNRIFCYSGDSGDCKGLRDAAREADLAIMEATLPRTSEEPNHISGDELGKLAQETNIKKLIVTHVADCYLPKVKKEVRQSYSGPIKLAKDLMRLKL